MENTPYDLIERMIRHTEEFARRQIEHELSLDGIQRRLSQLVDTLYLGMVVITPLVCLYDLGTLERDREGQRAPIVHVWWQDSSHRKEIYDASR